MLDKLTGKPVHYSIHFIALLAIAVGLPWSKIPLSLGTMLIVANLLLKADFKSYWQAWKQNSWLKVFLIYVIIEWISLIWTANWDYALNDMRRKLTLYSIPLAMVAFPLKSKKELFILALAFLSVLVITSFLNFGSYFHWWGNKSYVDIRSMSMFGSHIRFSMEIVMGIVICLAWILRRLPYFGIAFGIILWLVVYTYFSQVLTGYVSLAIVLFVSLLLILKNLSSKTVRVSTLVGFTLLVLGSCAWIYDQLKPIEHKIELSSINAYSKNGEFYYLDRNTPWENGYPVLAQLARKELEQEWNKVSKIPYKDGKDIKGNRIQFTLMTYMTSRGLTKDKEGFKQLSRKEIRQIEMGTNSILIAKGGLKARLHGIRMQMEYSEDPNGHSLLQRFEYWKAAKHIISENWLFGVGLGDIDDAFKDYYKKSHSKLTAENQHRSHNQFMTTWITSGILGFIAFAFWWGFQLKSAWNIKAFEWLCFASIAFVSFLTEDTIETQLGITFISFFFGIFISNHKLLVRDASRTNNNDASRTNNL